MSARDIGATVSDELDQARKCVERTHQALAERPPVPARAAHATVDGVYRLATALAGLVAALTDQLPAAVEGDDEEVRKAADEVVADLRAMHGCLTTGVLLLDPALEDLRGLSAATTTTDGETVPREHSPRE